MNSETIIYCIFGVILGMLVFHMLKNICGCKVVEGQGNRNQNKATPSQVCDNYNKEGNKDCKDCRWNAVSDCESLINKKDFPDFKNKKLCEEGYKNTGFWDSPCIFTPSMYPGAQDADCYDTDYQYCHFPDKNEDVCCPKDIIEEFPYEFKSLDHMKQKLTNLKVYPTENSFPLTIKSIDHLKEILKTVQ